MQQDFVFCCCRFVCVSSRLWTRIDWLLSVTFASSQFEVVLSDIKLVLARDELHEHHSPSPLLHLDEGLPVYMVNVDL